MASEWKTIRAADFIEFNPRLSIKKGAMATKVAMDKLQPFTKKIPATEQAEFAGGSKFCNGDTIMARITPCLENGKTAHVDILADGEVAFGSTEFIVMRARAGISDPQFVYYLATSPAFRNVAIKSMVGSSGRQRVQQGVLDELELIVPPLEEQQKIGAMLAMLDQKIALNNKINDNLLQQAQSVFTDWFVRFTPFASDELVASPIEMEIPKSLSMIQIGDVPHILETGRRPKGGAADSGIPSVGAENVKQLGMFDFSSKKFIPEDFAAKQKTGRIKGYELLLYKDGGKPGTFIPHFSMFGEGFPYTDFFINEHVFKLDFFDRGKNIFAYFYMQTDYATSWLANNGGKAAIPGINQQDVRAIWIYDMDHPQVQQFCRWVEPLFKTIFCNCYENMRLADLRDTLLPKLISGKIDVSSVKL